MRSLSRPLLPLLTLLAACVEPLRDDAPAPLVLEVAWPSADDTVTFDRPIAVHSSGWIRDVDAIRDTFALTAGNLSIPMSVTYTPSDTTLWIWPHDLLPHTTYTLHIDPSALTGLAGEPVIGPEATTFSVDTVALTAVEPLSFAADVAPALEGCACHREDPRLPPLTYAYLTEAESRDWPGRRLVVPFAPGRSYLMHKVLPDYPDRVGAAMPPPWDTDASDPAQVTTLETWILTGALP